MSVITFNPAPSRSPTDAHAGRGFDDLGQADFIHLMTVQMQQQDPFEPIDNKEMLAQMAQFSNLSSTDRINVTLSEMSSKLDQLIAAQSAASS